MTYNENYYHPLNDNLVTSKLGTFNPLLNMLAFVKIQELTMLQSSISGNYGPAAWSKPDAMRSKLIMTEQIYDLCHVFSQFSIIYLVRLGRMYCHLVVLWLRSCPEVRWYCTIQLATYDFAYYMNVWHNKSYYLIIGWRSINSLPHPANSQGCPSNPSACAVCMQGRDSSNMQFF